MSEFNPVNDVFCERCLLSEMELFCYIGHYLTQQCVASMLLNIPNQNFVEIFILITVNIQIFSDFRFINKFIVRIICCFFIQRVFFKATIITDKHTQIPQLLIIQQNVEVPFFQGLIIPNLTSPGYPFFLKSFLFLNILQCILWFLNIRKKSTHQTIQLSIRY